MEKKNQKKIAPSIKLKKKPNVNKTRKTAPSIKLKNLVIRIGRMDPSEDVGSKGAIKIFAKSRIKIM